MQSIALNVVTASCQLLTSVEVRSVQDTVIITNGKLGQR